MKLPSVASVFLVILVGIMPDTVHAAEPSDVQTAPKPSPEAKRMFGEGVPLGTLAPDFALNQIAGDDPANEHDERLGNPIRLSDFRGKKPVVLIFGSHTCPPFRRTLRSSLNKLHDHYKEHAQFLFVYVREAHPKEHWAIAVDGVYYPDPKTLADRKSMAETCRNTLHVRMPTVVDDVDDAVGVKYGAMPNRLYLIDVDGEVAFRSKSGPVGYQPDDVEIRLRKLISMPPQQRALEDNSSGGAGR
ncbi:MAG: deiodinase-like protein [Pirellulales bacterium]